MRRLAILLILLALLCPYPYGGRAATVVHLDSRAVTTNATSYSSNSFVPAAGDLIVVFVAGALTSAADATMTDSQSLGFTLVTGQDYHSGADRVYCFVANGLAAASSMTVTFDCTSDIAGGVNMFVAGVAGMSRTGISAIKQSQVDLGAAGTTPDPIFAAAVLTGNPTLGIVGNGSNPATMTEPTGWTELADTGHATPASGAEYVHRDSGFTGTQVTWGSTSALAWGCVVVELDTSAAAAGATRRRTVIFQ